MLLTLALPRINPHVTSAVITSLHAQEGAALGLGAKLLDLMVDISGAALVHDCPPISCYRLVMRDRAWLRRLHVTAGQTVQVGQPIALLSTEPDEPVDTEPSRAVRVTIAGIVSQSTPWGENAF